MNVIIQKYNKSVEFLFGICVSGSSGILFAFLQKDIADDTTKACFFAWFGNAQIILLNSIH